MDVIAGEIKGHADLVAYFTLRAHDVLNDGGQTGIIATNTLAQGDTREVGLDQIVDVGNMIRQSIKSQPWPSKSAVLEYCAVWTSRASLDERSIRIADGVAVASITSSLDPGSRATGQPERLAKSSGIVFNGQYIMGIGFTTPVEFARELIGKDPKNSEVLFPYLSGQDVNSRADSSASRWVINFHDWPEVRASTYPDCFNHVKLEVRPDRFRQKDEYGKRYWWQFFRRRPELQKAAHGLEHVIVMTLHTKTVMPVMVPTGQVFSHALGVFATDDTAMLALLSSAPHYWWAITRGSTLETRVRYTPSDVFETFPLPELTEEMRELGDLLDTLRRGVMLSRDSGLTKTYNLAFNPACTDEDIEELRRIHRAIDEATIRAYGWEERIEQVGGLDHGFHKVGREIRYTIGPAAQREVMDSLLELNHERYAEEVAQGLHDKKKSSRRDAGEQDMLL